MASGLIFSCIPALAAFEASQGPVCKAARDWRPNSSSWATAPWCQEPAGWPVWVRLFSFCIKSVNVESIYSLYYRHRCQVSRCGGCERFDQDCSSAAFCAKVLPFGQKGFFLKTFSVWKITIYILYNHESYPGAPILWPLQWGDPSRGGQRRQ